MLGVDRFSDLRNYPDWQMHFWENGVCGRRLSACKGWRCLICTVLVRKAICPMTNAENKNGKYWNTGVSKCRGRSRGADRLQTRDQTAVNLHSSRRQPAGRDSGLDVQGRLRRLRQSLVPNTHGTGLGIAGGLTSIEVALGHHPTPVDDAQGAIIVFNQGS